MLQSTELRDQLHALKDDITRVQGTNGEGVSNTMRDEIAEQIKAALSDLEQAMFHEEDHAESMISDQPITTLASAFALGVVVGVTLRKPN